MQMVVHTIGFNPKNTTSISYTSRGDEGGALTAGIYSVLLQTAVVHAVVAWLRTT